MLKAAGKQSSYRFINSLATNWKMKWRYLATNWTEFWWTNTVFFCKPLAFSAPLAPAHLRKCFFPCCCKSWLAQILGERLNSYPFLHFPVAVWDSLVQRTWILLVFSFVLLSLWWCCWICNPGASYQWAGGVMPVFLLCDWSRLCSAIEAKLQVVFFLFAEERALENILKCHFIG